MEKLEETLQEAEIGEDISHLPKASYEGLQLIESRSYRGGTSIRYWM